MHPASREAAAIVSEVSMEHNQDDNIVTQLKQRKHKTDANVSATNQHGDKVLKEERTAPRPDVAP
jgi:hypothetical protein